MLGNGGTARGIEKISNIENVNKENCDGLVKVARELRVILVVPGKLPLHCLHSGPGTRLRFVRIKIDIPRPRCTHSNWYRGIFSLG